MKDQLLYEKILSFDIDGQPVQFGFTQRLGRDNNWTPIFAEKVVREYKRFIYLAMTEPETCVPSEAVDQAWHTHLTDSRSYWERFVPEVLRTPLHHEPNKGGVEEDDRHIQLYKETLRIYQEAFGEFPPGDVWPPVALRFAPAMPARRRPVAPFAALGIWLAFAGLLGFGLHSLAVALVIGFAVLFLTALTWAGRSGVRKPTTDGGQSFFDWGSGGGDGHSGGGHVDGGGGHGGHGCGGHGCGGHGCGGHGCGSGH